MGRKIEVKENANKYFNFFLAFFAPPSKWRPWHVPCLPYPRYATEFDASVANIRTKRTFTIAVEEHE